MSVKKTGTYPVTRLAFHSLANNQNYLPIVQKAFKDVIEPIYGDQTRALRKIREGRDRKCEVLTRDDTAVGILVYKTQTQDEYKEFRLKKSMEIKTLMVIDPAKNSGQGLGSQLLKRAHRVAIRMLASTIHVTVSEGTKQAKDFFLHKKFKILKTWPDKYKKGVQEHLLAINVSSRHRSGNKGSTQTNTTQVTRTDPIRVKRKRLDDGQTPPVEEKSQRERRKKIKLKRDGTSSYRKERSSDIEMKGCDTRERPREVYDRPRYRGRRRNDSSRSRRSAPQPRGRGVNPSFYDQKNEWHLLTLKSKYIHQIQSGQKTVEGRIAGGIVQNYKVGDKIRFFYNQNQRDDVVCTITRIDRYSTFPEMLKSVGFQKCLTDVRTYGDAVSVYHSIPGYQRRAQQRGVVAIHLEVVN